jgi:hypothetical protein
MAMTMVGTQAPQKLFGDVPAEVSGIPGAVTPNITAAMPQYADLEGILGALNKQKEISANAWARAAAMNNARAQQRPQDQGVDLPGTASQTSGMGYQNGPHPTGSSGIPGFQGPVLWAPRNLRGPALGTWSERERQKADAAHKRPPVILQAYADDPYSPGEAGAGIPLRGGSITGPGLTTPLGGANPAVLARMWGGGGGGGGGSAQSYGRTRQAQPQDVFPEESLRSRTSPGPKYQYDLWGGR